MNNLDLPTVVPSLLGQLSSFSAFTKPPDTPKPVPPTAQIDLATLVALVQNLTAQQQVAAATPTLTLPFVTPPTVTTTPSPAVPTPSPSPPSPTPTPVASQSLENLALEVRALAVQLYQRVVALEKEMATRKEKQAAKAATSALGSMAASKRPIESSPEAADPVKKVKLTEPRCEPLTDEISDVKGEEDSEGESDDDFDRKKGIGKSHRSKLPSYAIEILTNWIMDHKHSPYPSVEEKDRLCELTGMTPMQLNNWFGNARRRILPIARKTSEP